MDPDLVGAIRLEPAEIFDSALLGMAERNGQMVLVYDYDEIIKAVAHDIAPTPTTDEWSDAIEYVEFNTIRGIEYMGERRPVVVYRDVDMEEGA